jgi:hypothetical protein
MKAGFIKLDGKVNSQRKSRKTKCRYGKLALITAGESVIATIPGRNHHASNRHSFGYLMTLINLSSTFENILNTYVFTSRIHYNLKSVDGFSEQRGYGCENYAPHNSKLSIIFSLLWAKSTPVIIIILRINRLTNLILYF